MMWRTSLPGHASGRPCSRAIGDFRNPEPEQFRMTSRPTDNLIAVAKLDRCGSVAPMMDCCESRGASRACE